jgi:tRNA threonylcarbamoyladenosine biosynthesis protein TsaB
MASRYCRLASKYCRMAGVAPAGWDDTGGEDIEARSAEYNIQVVLVLALDTTTRAGSAAVVRDGAVVLEQTGDSTLTHGQRLPHDLMRLLDEASVGLASIELFAVAAGPGSFTGLRVGIATMQGLAMAGNRRIVPVSTLEALARAGRNGIDPVAPWMDAQRGEVFAAVYAPDGRALHIEPSSEHPQRTLERWTRLMPDALLRFIGDGAVRYRDVIHRHRQSSSIAEPVPPLAAYIGTIACEEPHRAVVPHAVVPIYIRRSDAELARDKRGAAGC